MDTRFGVGNPSWRGSGGVGPAVRPHPLRGQLFLTWPDLRVSAGTDVRGDIVQGRFEPCLLALLRLSVRRDRGTGLTSGWFPRVLARTGHPVRAAEPAYTISDELGYGTRCRTLRTGRSYGARTPSGAGSCLVAQSILPTRSPRRLILRRFSPWPAVARGSGRGGPRDWNRVESGAFRFRMGPTSGARSARSQTWADPRRS